MRYARGDRFRFRVARDRVFKTVEGEDVDGEGDKDKGDGGDGDF